MDEPYELQVLAQKGAAVASSTERFDEYLDTYLACMENYFSELALGRRYNFRRADKSCVFNVKSKESIRKNVTRRRRSDVIEHAAQSDSVFAVAFNDMEKGIDFIARKVPRPQVVYVRRPLEDVVREVAEKEWLSDRQLASQINLGQAFTTAVERDGQLIYVPHQIPSDLIDAFLVQPPLGRALLYSYLQEAELQRQLAKARFPVLRVELNDFLDRPLDVSERIFEFAEVNKTTKTDELLASIRGLVSNARAGNGAGNGRNGVSASAIDNAF